MASTHYPSSRGELYAAATCLFYRLFRRGDGPLALVAEAFSLLGCATDTFEQFHVVPARVPAVLFWAVLHSARRADPSFPFSVGVAGLAGESARIGSEGPDPRVIKWV